MRNSISEEYRRRQIRLETPRSNRFSRNAAKDAPPGEASQAIQNLVLGAMTLLHQPPLFQYHSLSFLAVFASLRESIPS
jgi:hypothetical protein